MEEAQKAIGELDGDLASEFGGAFGGTVGARAEFRGGKKQENNGIYGGRKNKKTRKEGKRNRDEEKQHKIVGKKVRRCTTKRWVKLLKRTGLLFFWLFALFFAGGTRPFRLDI